ncbi:MAG: hypothetical protein KDA95_05965 [Acidimicrobiales bacterium]|nr:hypothetical protein [Acidimicrobiales bacterium]
MKSPQRSAVRPGVGVLLAAFLVMGSSGCSSDSKSSTNSNASTTEPAGSSTTEGGNGATTEPDGGSTTSTTSGSVTTTTAFGGSTSDVSNAGDGTAIALLKDVRVALNAGFERIVFEFEGESIPGYRVGWVDGPITEDGSGNPVDVKGSAYLEIIMQQASGVDLSSTDLRETYTGPTRIDLASETEVLTEMVRTGDFEAVLSWVAGASGKVPFRVSTLRSPTRVVIDVAA